MVHILLFRYVICTRKMLRDCIGYCWVGGLVTRHFCRSRRGGAANLLMTFLSYSSSFLLPLFFCGLFTDIFDPCLVVWATEVLCKLSILWLKFVPLAEHSTDLSSLLFIEITIDCCPITSRHHLLRVIIASGWIYLPPHIHL